MNFTEKAAHASAAPWEGKNALNGVQLMIHAIDMLRQHTKARCSVSWCDKGWRSFPNIVPEKAVYHLFIRAGSKDYMEEELIRLTDDCAAGAALATQTTWERTLKTRPTM